MTRILAYADRVSARPGETINVMVSCDGVERYDVDLIRVIHGDVNPEGPGYQAEPVPFDFGGPKQGRHQPINPGSYGLVDDNAAFAGLSSFTVQAALWPTLPGAGEQIILCRRDPYTGSGFRLLLDDDGALAFELCSNGSGTVIVSTRKLLLVEKWYAVAGGYDAATGEVFVGQTPSLDYPRTDDAGFSSLSAAAGLSQGETASAVMIGAQPAQGCPAAGHFNGRIDSPCIWSRALAEHEIEELPDPDGAAHGDLVAAWDFSIGIPTDHITDISPNRFHGRLINLPTRGVPGRNWTSEEHNWTKRPDHYGAIHFHDDDLYDCGWDVDFTLTVPETLTSGLYAVRMHAGDEEYFIPFAVRPAPGQPTSDIAFLLPTASYMAYANNRIGIDFSETEIVIGRLIQLNKSDLFQQEHPELGLCFYDLHNDGSAVYYSSRLRPIINMQPKHMGHLGGVGSNLWQFNADTHILAWLKQLEQPFDVITDEDLDAEGHDALAGYRVVVTGTHPEYYSVGMLDALQGHVDQGGRLMYLGGNGFYWRIAYHQTLPGVIECRKSEDGIRTTPPRPGEFYSSFTGEYTGLWRRNGRAPNELAGVGMVSQGFDISAPYVRTEASRDGRAAFIFEDVDDEVIGDFGLSGGGAAGLELDAADTALGTPPHVLVLAYSRRHTDVYLMTPEDMHDPVPGMGGTEAEIIRADMVFFETSNGGAVFSTGSIAWAGSLSHNGYTNNVEQISTNVLTRFCNPAPL